MCPPRPWAFYTMIEMIPLAAGVLLAQLAVEVPSRVVVDPPTVVELAGSAAVSWDGHAVPLLRPIVRRLTGVFRVTTPPGLSEGSLYVEVKAQSLRPKDQHRGGGEEMPVQVTVLPLRLVRESPEASVWEGDLLLLLDPTRTGAGEFQGTLSITVSVR